MKESSTGPTPRLFVPLGCSPRSGSECLLICDASWGNARPILRCAAARRDAHVGLCFCLARFCSYSRILSSIAACKAIGFLKLLQALFA
ncbi:hypothetical protein H9L39_08346 [Fusarium oxysporum f. sp. albedinis]|nr:hypothetical protein H9L39_08346 [Fusarium oxysporum f. sp. albedinis]